MKTKNLFLATIVTLFGVVIESSGQTDNTFAGNGAGTNNTGDYNSGFGVNSLLNNTSNSNSAFGVNTLSSSTGGFNCAFGSGALLLNGNGQYNCAIGTRALENNLTGYSNIAIGHRSLGDSNISGINNTAVGYASLLKSSGNNNTAIGYYSPRSLLSGNNNVFVGYQTAINLSNGSNNVFIGSNLTVPNSPATSTSAGNNSNSTIIIGDGAGLQRIYVNSNGFTGIGLGNNQIPQNRLEINSFAAVTGTTGLRFRGFNNTLVSPNGKVLTVNSNGDVVLTTDQGSGGQTLIEAGPNVSVTGAGVVGDPYLISSTSGNENLYTSDGVIDDNSAFDHLRYVNMNHNNIHFGTSFSEYGKIYIGQSVHTSFEFLDTMNQTNLENYKLFVEGGIITERVKVALRYSADWADYVFADNYKLMPLNELETFVKENKHLPGVKSAEELSKSGIDVVEMQSKQMEKIEELTLYAIEQNKQIDQQSIEIENQSKELEKQSKELEELKAQVKALLERK